MEPYNTAKASSVSYTRKRSYKSSFGYGAEWWVWDAKQVTSSSLNGWTNPKWREQVAAHTCATTPCSGVRRSLDPGWGYVENLEMTTAPGYYYGSWQLNRSWGEIYDTNGNSFPDVPPLPASTLANSALVRFYSDISSKLDQADGMVALGELRETVGMLKHPLRSLRDLLTKREKFLKGKWNRLNRVRSVKERKILGKDLKNAVADTWLEAQFGLKPLCKDIENLVTYLQFRRFQLGVSYYPIKGIARSINAIENDAARWSANDSRCWYQKKRRTEARQKCRYIGELKVDPLEPGITEKDFNRLGFSLNRFVPTLWEITPWSFLVDYFTNVGDVINSFSVPLNQIAWFNKTERSETTQRMWLTGVNSGREYTVGGYVDPTGFQCTPSKAVAMQFKRTGDVGIHLPRPKISFELPSGTKIVNMFALAASDSRKRFSNPLT